MQSRTFVLLVSFALLHSATTEAGEKVRVQAEGAEFPALLDGSVGEPRSELYFVVRQCRLDKNPNDSNSGSIRLTDFDPTGDKWRIPSEDYFEAHQGRKIKVNEWTNKDESRVAAPVLVDKEIYDDVRTAWIVEAFDQDGPNEASHKCFGSFAISMRANHGEFVECNWIGLRNCKVNVSENSDDRSRANVKFASTLATDLPDGERLLNRSEIEINFVALSAKALPKQ